MSATPDVPETSEQPEVELLPVEKEMAKLHEKVVEELAQIEPQYHRLVDIRRRLEGGQTPATPAASAPSPAPARRGRSGRNGSAGRGRTQEQFLAAVRENPGLKIPDYAKAMEMGPNYLYRVREKAKAANLIRIEGQNIFPMEPASV